MLKAQIIGNLGADPEMKYSANGAPFLRFSVASNYRTRDRDGEWSDATEWVRVTLFGQRAETISDMLKKGMRVYCDGRLEARPWAGDRDGVLHAGLELIANDVQFFSPREEDDRQQQGTRQPAAAGSRSGGGQQRQSTRQAEDEELEDLPF